MLGGIVQNVNGQTYHNKYVPQAGTSYVSFVNTSNPLTSESWYIFTTANKEVIINKMDFNFPCSDPVQTWAYTINAPNLGDIYFKDCFFVPDGTSIFCYGYENSTSNRGVMLRIKIDTTTGLVTGINFTNINQPNSPIKSACWANNNFSSSFYHYCFGIVAGDTVTRVVVNSAGFFTTNVGSNGSNYTSPFTNFIHSISYDPNENCFIVSGTYKDICFYCVKISNGVDFIKSDANVFGLTAFQGNLFFEYPSYNKTMSNVMKLIPGGKLFIAQSMRTVNNRYFIYIVHYDYYNNIVLSNTLYETTTGSMYLTNISTDYDNNYIYILGHINTSPARKFVFQVEQNFPNNYKMQTMQDATVSTPAYLYAGEIEYLSSMSFSDAFSSMDISGAVNGEAYIVHAYDLSYNDCDNDINLTIVTNQHTNNYYNVLTDAPNLSYLYKTTATFQYTMNPCTALCWQTKSLNQIKSKINENLKNKNIIQSNELSKQKIEVFENQFVARDFEGLCSYTIIDISGKVVQEGITSNDNINNLNVPKSGFYVIVVIDENNNIEKQKVVIMK